VPERPPPSPDPQAVPTSTLVAAVVLTAIITAGLSIFAIATIFERGPEGARGPQGISGAPAPADDEREGARQLDAQAIADAIEEDPDPVTQALDRDAVSDELGGSGAAPGDEDLAARVDELETELSDARDDLAELCDELSASDALLDASLPC
jgi:hypothetical protein